VEVSLSEFAITPTMPTAPVGKVVLHVTNTGSMVHNLSVPSLGLKTPDLQPGEDVTLNLGSVPAGEVDFLCEISGHAASGMTAMLMVGSDAASGASGSSGGAAAPPMSWQEMDKMMLDVATQFPATTAGLGGQIM